MGILTKEELLKRAPTDIKEAVIDVPEWGEDAQVRVKALTSAESAAVTDSSIRIEGKTTHLNTTELQIAQFTQGVVEPKMTANEVRVLHLKSGPGFQRVVNWIGENSGLDEEKVAELKRRFQGAPEGPESASTSDGAGEADEPDAS